MKRVNHGTIVFSKELLADLKECKQPHHYKWTPEIDEFIRQYYGTIPNKDLLSLIKKHFGVDAQYRSVYDRYIKIRD